MSQGDIIWDDEIHWDDAQPQQAAQQPANGIDNANLPLWSVNKTIAGIGDSVTNAPTNLANLGIAGVGTAAALAGHPELAPNTLPTPDIASRLFKAAGLDIAPRDLTAGQKWADAGIQGVTAGLVSPANGVRQGISNAVSGGVGGLSGEAATQATGNPLYGLAASIAVPGAGQAAAQRNAGNLARSAEQNAARDATWRQSQAAGYVVPPSAVNPSAINRALESVAGKAATKQQATINNQQTTSRISGNDIGINGSVTEGAITRAEQPYFDTYRQVGSLSPEARQAMQFWRDANFNRGAQLRYYERSANPEAQRAAQQAANEADQWFQYLTQQAVQHGRPELAQQLADARRELGRIGTLERAHVPETGEVLARSLGRAVDRGEPINGGMRTAGEFSNAFEPFSGQGSKTPTPGISALSPVLATALGIGGYGAAGIPGIAAAALPLIRGPVRSMLLSGPYQRMMANPNYDQNLIASLLGNSSGAVGAQQANAQQQAILAALLQQGN